MPPELTPESPTNASPSNATVRMALGVSYNGQGYNGWQSQLSGNTVQDKLEAALGRFCYAYSEHPVCGPHRQWGAWADAGRALRHPLRRPNASWVRGTNTSFATRHCGAMGSSRCLTAFTRAPVQRPGATLTCCCSHPCAPVSSLVAWAGYTRHSTAMQCGKPPASCSVNTISHRSGHLPARPRRRSKRSNA